jgi:hypothetical protein
MVNISARIGYSVFAKAGSIDEKVFYQAYKEIRVLSSLSFLTESRYNMPIFPSLTFLEY